MGCGYQPVSYRGRASCVCGDGVGHYERFALRLRYLIGKDADPGTDDSITVIGYDATTPPKNGVKYINLLDEKGSRQYGPYLPDNDMTAQYGEPVPDPKGEGFWRNLREQLDRAKAQGFTSVELDNLDSFDASVALLCFDEVARHGFKVFVKNPLLVDGNHAALMRHPAACGAIVEPDCGTPAEMQAIRNGLPVYFVSGDYEDPAASFPNLPTGQTMAWRLAKSLETLRDQVNAKWPNRDKSLDGTIGDAAHQATKSDHNPNSAGVVTAMDITHDPANGLDARKLAETLVASRDPRIKYIISNAQIISSQTSPWIWRPYSGANAHRQHVHISVAGDYDDTRPWNLGETPVAVPGRNTNITATRFSDSRVAYTDVAPGWNNRMGVALPYRFKGERPKVRVFKGGKSVVCEIMDIGPWYDGTAERGPFDPYWETGSRPRAESDPKTNGAGIDLTFPADAALGLNGKGLVDWEFVKDAVKDEPVTEPAPATTLKEVLSQLAEDRKQVNARFDSVIAMVKKAQELADKPPPKEAPTVDSIGMVPEWAIPAILPVIQRMSADEVIAFLRSYKAAKASGSNTWQAIAIGAGAGFGGLGLGAFIVEIISKLAQGG